MGGLIPSAPVEIHDANIGFYGGGCPHVGIECLIGKINKIVMHYGCPSNDGLQQKISLELLTMEIDLSFQPF